MRATFNQSYHKQLNSHIFYFCCFIFKSNKTWKVKDKWFWRKKRLNLNKKINKFLFFFISNFLSFKSFFSIFFDYSLPPKVSRMDLVIFNITTNSNALQFGIWKKKVFQKSPDPCGLFSVEDCRFEIPQKNKFQFVFKKVTKKKIYSRFQILIF